MQVTVAHHFPGGVAIYAVEFPFAFRELADRLMVVLHTRRRMIIGARQKRHLAQQVIATIVAGVTLGIGYGRGQPVLPGMARLSPGDRRVAARVRPFGVAEGMARCASGQALVAVFAAWRRREVARQARRAELLDGWIRLGRGIESSERGRSAW